VTEERRISDMTDEEVRSLMNQRGPGTTLYKQLSDDLQQRHATRQAVMSDALVTATKSLSRATWFLVVVTLVLAGAAAVQIWLMLHPVLGGAR
jgi:CHASE3 domain sensor protein